MGRLLHVNHNATGSISQILDNHMHHQSQYVCSNCNAPLDTTIHFSETHKVYAIDVTDRNVLLSQTIKIQGPRHATALHLRGLVYHGGYHFTCQIIDQFGNGMTTGKVAPKDERLGSISQPNL